MRRTAISLVVISFAVLSGIAVDATEPIRLRVLSYNIHHAEGVDRELSVERIAKVISSVSPDIVALQEVDQRVKRSKVVDQPAELARLTRLHVAFAANIEFQGGHYGNAVLSRFPIKGHKNHLLPNIDGSEQRGVIEAEIKVAEEIGAISLLATHLDYRKNERERLASARAINGLIGKNADQPAILAGDLNAIPESETLQRFKSHWTMANDRPLATVPVDQPSRQIDYILYRPKNRWKVKEVKVLDEAVASDHRAIFAVLELSPNTRD